MADGQLFEDKKKDDSFKPITPDGTPLNEAVSLLIKELRRGKELNALYWATQIEENFWKYLWRRLLIFAAEDVGIGTPYAIASVHALAEAYSRVKKESRAKTPDGNLVSMAVLLLARCDKNREADNLKNVLYVLRKRYGWMPEVPEYAIDAHTARGRAIYTDKQERDRMWFTEWSLVDPKVGPYDWELWHLRRLVAEGAMEHEDVEKIAAGWEEAGMLEYGMEGPEPKPS